MRPRSTSPNGGAETTASSAAQAAADDIRGIVVVRPCNSAASWYRTRQQSRRDQLDDPLSYQLASVSKQFTAYMCMHLLQDLGLSVDAEISTVSDLDGTFRDLLTHRAPFPDIAHQYARQRWSQTGDATKSSHVLEHIEGEGLGQSTPSFGSYGNTSYVVLAALLERLDNSHYDEIFERLVRAPLQFSAQTRCWDTSVTEPFPERAVETSRLRKERTLPLYDGLRGDGAVFATGPDLQTWVTMWGDARSEDNALLSGSFTPEKDFAGTGDVQFGLGWILRGDGAAWHDGSWLSSRSLHVNFPSGAGMLMATNYPTSTLFETATKLRPHIEPR